MANIIKLPNKKHINRTKNVVIIIINGLIALAAFSYMFWPQFHNLVDRYVLGYEEDPIISAEDHETINQLNEDINNSSDNSNKSEIYVKLSSIYNNYGEVDETISNALKAIELNPSYGNYEYLASIYEDHGDKEQAILYYNKALEDFIDEHGEGGGQISSEYYVEKINELSE